MKLRCFFGVLDRSVAATALALLLLAAGVYVSTAQAAASTPSATVISVETLDEESITDVRSIVVDDRPDLARPPPAEFAPYVYDTPTELSDPAADDGWVRRAPSGSDGRLVAPTSAVDDLGRLSCRSFSGDTQVVMVDGTTEPISEVVVGDLVLASDPETGERAAQTVVRTLPHSDELLVLETTVGRLRTTEDHLFWNLTDGEWQESQELDEGDALLSSVGGSILAIGLDWQTARVDTAYDLDVSGFDTFFVSVGDESALVHNIEYPWQLRVDTNFSSGHNQILDGPLPQTGQLSDLTRGQLLDLQSDLTTSITNRQHNLWDGTFPTVGTQFENHAARVNLEIGLLDRVTDLLG